MNTHIDARVREIFRQLPLLIGFSLDRELCVCNIEIETWPGCPWSDPDYGETAKCWTTSSRDRRRGRGRSTAGSHLRARVALDTRSDAYGHVETSSIWANDWNIAPAL